MGCLRVGEAAKGRTVDNKPGTRVDGFSHHEQKKLVLQVSTKEGLIYIKGNGMKAKWEARRRVN